MSLGSPTRISDHRALVLRVTGWRSVGVSAQLSMFAAEDVPQIHLIACRKEGLPDQPLRRRGGVVLW